MFKNKETLMQRSRPVIVLFLFVSIAACNQDASPDDLPETPNEKLAYAIAEAMNHPDAREEVHGAMDASPYNEHKLVFGEFLEKPESAAFKQELVNVLGSEQVLNGLLDELPSMDFYLPYETHRETWEHAMEDLYVAVVPDSDTQSGQVSFYHPDGSSKSFSSREQMEKEAKASFSMFILHPEEPKIPRGGIVSAPGKTMKSIRITKIKNYTNDGITGGGCEFYFLVSRVGESDEIKTFAVSVPSAAPWNDEHSTQELSIGIYDGIVLSWRNKLKVRVMEADGGLLGKDDDYGYFIATGSGSYETSKKTDFRFGPDSRPYPKAVITIKDRNESIFVPLSQDK